MRVEINIKNNLEREKDTRPAALYRSLSRNILIPAAVCLLFSALLPSCKTVEKSSSIITKTADEERLLMKVKEWEEYLNTGKSEAPDSFIATLSRITDEYLGARELLFKKEMENYERQMSLFQKGELKKEPKEPRQDYSVLISHFKILIEQYRYRNGADAIYYALAYALYEQGERDKAIEVFEHLLRNYPKSNYFLEVSFRLGEFYFETGQMPEAMGAYSRVSTTPQSVFYEKAVYKLGWVYYKLDDFKKAVDAFMTAADMERGLGEEAVSSVVMSLSRFGTMEEAIQHLRNKGIRKYTPLVLAMLGDRLAEETRYEAAIIVYMGIQELFPDSPLLPFISEKTAELYERIGNEEKSLTTRWELMRNYSPKTSWYAKNYPGGSEASVDNLVSRTMVSISKKYHIKGKNNGNTEDIARAIDGYRIFLASYPKSTELKEINLLLAEALFDTKNYREAASAYEKTGRLYPEEQQRADIAYSAFLAYEIMFYQAVEDKMESVKSIENLLEAYKADFSKDDRLDKMLYKVADMYSQSGSSDKAKEKLTLLMKGKNPQPAYEKIAELYIKEGNLKSAEDAYLKLRDISKDQNSKKGELAGLRYKIAEEYLKAGKEKDGISKLEQAYNTDPGSRTGEAALIKLGSIYIRNRDMSNLENLVNLIIRNYPGSEGSVSLLVEGGKKLEKEDPLTAARLYESASAVSPHTKDAIKLLRAAGMLYEDNSADAKAELLFKKYLQENMETGDSEAEIRYRLGIIQINMGKKNEGRETLSALLEGKEADERFSAMARLLIIKEKQLAYYELKLTQPFEETLKQKTQQLESLLNDYSQIAEYKIPELLPETFFQMGMAIENFRDSIINSERPGDMSKEEVEEYTLLLEEKAYPYDEQAVKTYEKSLTVSRKQQIYNEWVEKSIGRLAGLRPALYKREFESRDVEPLFIYPEPVSMESNL